MGKKERSFMKSGEAIVHVSNVSMIPLFYLHRKNLEVSGKAKFYRNKGLTLPIYYIQS